MDSYVASTKASVASIKDRLYRYLETEAEIEMELERYENLDVKIQGLHSPQITDMPKGGPVEYRLEALLDQKAELDEKIKRLSARQTYERRWIEEVLSHLSKASEREVIRLKYIDACSWNDVAFSLFGGNVDFNERDDSYIRRTTKLHGRALAAMAEHARNCTVRYGEKDEENQSEL